MRLLLPLLLLLAPLTACGGPPEATRLWEDAVIRQAKERGVLVVAMEPEFPPFESKDASGAFVGFDVDLAREIADALGVELQLRDVKWEAIVGELLAGRADLIISGMTLTPERALTLSYTDPYYETITCLLLSRTRAADVRGIEDLDDPERIVATKLGTTGESAARQRCPRARIKTFPTESAAALEVAQGRADAFLYDRAPIRRYHAEHPDTTRVVLDPVTIEPYAIALRKGDPESVAWLNVLLDDLRRRGRLEELHVRHGLADREEER